jgi:hypothetical protein
VDNVAENASSRIGELVPSGGANPQRDTKLEVAVVYTTERGTVAALKTAGKLAKGLHATIHLLAPQIVPYALPLDHPPVSPRFTERRCRAMALACTEASEVRVEICLCRNKRAALLWAIQPHALIIIGGRKRWWRSSEERLAGMLQEQGRRVIFVDQNRTPTQERVRLFTQARACDVQAGIASRLGG